MKAPPGEPIHQSATLRDRIRQRQPSELPLSTYVSGWAQALIQLAVFLASLVMLWSETHPGLVMLYSIAFGWSWFALLMIGHDAMHRAFAPWRSVNGIVAFLTLDCLLFSRAVWLHGHHRIHHANPHSSEDMMYLRARSIAGDMWNLLVMVLNYLAWDVERLVNQPTWHEWLGMGIRIGLIWSLMPFALLPAIFFLLLFGNYLGLLSHSLPVRGHSADPVIRQLRTAWDLYPESFVASLLTGGLNAHVTHHVYPSLPRGAQKLGTHVLREEAGSEYRSIQSLAGLWTLFRFRHCSTSEIATIEAIRGGRVFAGFESYRGTDRIDSTLSVYEWMHRSVQNTQQSTRLAARRGVYLLNAAFAGRVGSSAARGDSRMPPEKRVGERRVEQTYLMFPDRRSGDRRGRAIA